MWKAISVRRSALRFAAFLPAAFAASLLGCGGGGGGSSSPSPTFTPPPTTSATATVTATTPIATATTTPTSVPLPPLSTPIPLIEGRRMGADYFPAPNSSGQTIDGNACEASHFDYHIHSHLSIFLNGRQLAVPAAIGIVNPHFITTTDYPDGFADYGDCVYSLHTHDTSGKLHIEAPEKRTFTLGEVFDIWNQPLSRTNIAGITTGPLVIYINDGTNLRRYDGDPKAIELASKREITFQIGTPITTIPTFIWYGEGTANGDHEAVTAARFHALAARKQK